MYRQGEQDGRRGMNSLWVVFEFLTDVYSSRIFICMSYDFSSWKLKVCLVALETS